MASKRKFIGRKDELDRLRQEVFSLQPGAPGYCRSLIGLNDIGKTRLISELTKELQSHHPQNTFCFSTTVSDDLEGNPYWMFWTGLIMDFAESITEDVLRQAAGGDQCERDRTMEILKTYAFFAENMGIIGTPAFNNQALAKLRYLFPYYTEMGIRIIITIDEFDRAQEIFQDGQFFQFLYDLSPKAGRDLNLSIITISRRNVATIAHHMRKGSDFASAYPALVLHGFNDGELEEYFDTYRELSCGLPSEEAKKQILYFCGRSPGLLMGFRHELELMPELCTDIGRVYIEHGSFIKTAYSRMLTLMESTFADREQEESLLNVFIQKFIGPIDDDNFNEKEAKLYDYGFVTKGTVGSNIFVLSGEQTPDEDGEKNSHTIYEPISPYFIEYIKHTVAPSSLRHLSGLLIKAEKLVRQVIKKEMSKAFPDTWRDIINGYVPRKNNFLETLLEKALQDDFPSDSISKLNVIAFPEYYSIIDDYWDLFSKYFTAYPSKAELCSAMSLLHSGRNFNFHLNLDVYNGQSRQELQKACMEFISCLENGPRVPKVDPTEEQIVELIGADITFCCEKIKMPKGNLRGAIKEYGFPAGVSQKNLEAFGFATGPKVGDEFPAKVEQWDDHAKMFNLKAPT